LIAYVDTNVLIRHLTGEPRGLSARATRILKSADRLILTDLVVAEAVYVLESFYERPRSEIAESVRALLALKSIAVMDHDLLLRALELYEHVRLDFAEGYLAAAAELSGIGRVASFDRSLDRVGTIERIRR
jgi:predicted nucleic-acid-binding protein